METDGRFSRYKNTTGPGGPVRDPRSQIYRGTEVYIGRKSLYSLSRVTLTDHDEGRDEVRFFGTDPVLVHFEQVVFTRTLI